MSDVVESKATQETIPVLCWNYTAAASEKQGKTVRFAMFSKKANNLRKKIYAVRVAKCKNTNRHQPQEKVLWGKICKRVRNLSEIINPDDLNVLVTKARDADLFRLPSTFDLIWSHGLVKKSCRPFLQQLAQDSNIQPCIFQSYWK